jgi:hypothetical protein
MVQSIIEFIWPLFRRAQLYEQDFPAVKMDFGGTTVCTAVVNLGLKLFALGQACVTLSRVRSLNGLRLNNLNCEKLTNESISNTDAFQIW